MTIDKLDLDTIKHVSFDLWLTLIKSNPEFKLKRANLFREFFNIEVSLEEINKDIRYYDTVCNNINETTGLNIDTLEIYLLILSKYGIKTDLEILNQFYKETEDLFFAFKPTLLTHFDLVFFEELKAKGITVNILSNTGFIKGETLRKFISELPFSHCIDFQLYSDEEEISKPNPLFFQKVKDRLGDDVLQEHILHIGDNQRADLQGALEVGFKAYLIEN